MKGMKDMNSQANQITLPKYAKSYVKGFISAYKGKQLIFTIITGVSAFLLGTLFTAYVFPHLFSDRGAANQIYAGIATSLCIMTVLGAVMGVIHTKSTYFKNIGSGSVLLFSGYFAKETKLSDRIWVIGTTAVGAALGCLFSAPFMMILAIWMALDAFQPDGNLLTLVSAVQNSFNNAFRKNHVRNGESTRCDTLGLAIGMLLAAIVCAVIRGMMK